MTDWLSAVYALIIAILGFALIAVFVAPKNIRHISSQHKIPRSAIILIVLILIVGILWLIRHARLKREGYCSEYSW